MIPAGFVGVEEQLWAWLVAMLRPGAAMLAAPLFGARGVPVQVRLILSLAIGMAAGERAAVPLHAAEIISLSGVVLIANEVIAGAALGLAIQIGYAAALVAGEAIGQAMGLGFAGMVDPASGHSSPVVGAWLSTIAIFLFVGANGHLLLIRAIVDSYGAWPPGAAFDRDLLFDLAAFGGHALAAGVVVALPVAGALVLVQIAMAVLARAAPALNLFAVGFPAAILAGLALLALTAPLLSTGLLAALEGGLDMAQRLAAGG